MKKDTIVLLIVIIIFLFTIAFFNYKEGLDKGEWNSNPNDRDPWWNEHKWHEDPSYNNVKWNHHGKPRSYIDARLYPNIYRNINDNSNGYTDISFSSYYIKEREMERMKSDSDKDWKDSHENVDEDIPEDSTCPSLKCIADFGTNVGENLCCGQSGVLQNTEYVCPSVKPTCKNFKCGSKFGTCV